MQWVNATKLPDSAQDYGQTFWVSENIIVRNIDTKCVVDNGRFGSYGKTWGLDKYEWLDETEITLPPTQTEAWFEVPVSERLPTTDGYRSGIYVHLTVGLDVQDGKLHSMTFAGGKTRLFKDEPLEELEIIDNYLIWLEKRPVRPVAADPDNRIPFDEIIVK